VNQFSRYASAFGTRAFLIAGLLLLGRTADAQVTVPFPPTRPGQRPDSAQLADTVKVPLFRVQPPVSPLGALWRSLLVPGWGQSILGRRVTGAVFVVWEGVALTMTAKSLHQLHYAEQTGAVTVAAKRQEVQDWAVLLGFNHLLAGAEAFVSANLWDFPGNLHATALPPNGIGIGVTLPLGNWP
jgi:glucose/arabinose dehydrogenase